MNDKCEPISALMTGEEKAMNRKKLMNWVRSGFSMQQICEIGNCEKKADYCITKYGGKSVVVCRDHFDSGKAELGEAQ